MRPRWETVRLADVCAVDKVKYRDSELPFVGLEYIESGTGRFTGSLEPREVESSTFRFTPEHLLYGRLRPYLNKVLLPQFHGHCSSEIFPMLPGERLDRGFLYYWITSGPVVDAINRTSTGARMPRANIKEILDFRLPLPPLPEQKRIVSILDEAFAGIDAAMANAGKNLVNARELFESYLSSVFTEKGERWVEKKLSDVCDGKITDGTHQTPKYFDEGYIFLSSKNVVGGVIDWDKVRYVDEAQHVMFQKRLSPRKGDILLAKNGTTGVAAIVDRDTVFDIYVSLALLRPSDAIDPRFMLHFINSDAAKQQFNKRLKGVGVPNLHLKEIREVLMPYPESIAEQQRLALQFDAYLGEVQKLENIFQKKLSALTELRISLLEKAFAGELTTKPQKIAKDAALA